MLLNDKTICWQYDVVRKNMIALASTIKDVTHVRLSLNHRVDIGHTLLCPINNTLIVWNRSRYNTRSYGCEWIINAIDNGYINNRLCYSNVCTAAVYIIIWEIDVESNVRSVKIKHLHILDTLDKILPLRRSHCRLSADIKVFNKLIIFLNLKQISHSSGQRDSRRIHVRSNIRIEDTLCN